MVIKFASLSLKLCWAEFLLVLLKVLKILKKLFLLHTSVPLKVSNHVRTREGIVSAQKTVSIIDVQESQLYFSLIFSFHFSIYFM